MFIICFISVVWQLEAANTELSVFKKICVFILFKACVPTVDQELNLEVTKPPLQTTPQMWVRFDTVSSILKPVLDLLYVHHILFG